MSKRKKTVKRLKEVVEGVLWGGYKGEHNLKYPYYILQDEKHTFEKDELFVADILKKFVRKRIRITVKESYGSRYDATRTSIDNRPAIRGPQIVCRENRKDEC